MLEPSGASLNHKTECGTNGSFRHHQTHTFPNECDHHQRFYSGIHTNSCAVCAFCAEDCSLQSQCLEGLHGQFRKLRGVQHQDLCYATSAGMGAHQFARRFIFGILRWQVVFLMVSTWMSRLRLGPFGSFGCFGRLHQQLDTLNQSYAAPSAKEDMFMLLYRLFTGVLDMKLDRLDQLDQLETRIVDQC